MGRFLQLLLNREGGKIISKMMFKLCAALLFAGLAQAAPGYGHGSHYHEQSQCHTTYDVKYDTQCQTYYDQACHTEYDVVVDTTYVEECQDIVTQHCQETHQQVHHSSAVVGHDSQVVSHGHSGYGKREAKAEAEPGYGHNQHNNLQCFSKPHKQCHQKPVQNQRQECHEEYDVIIDTTYIEECQDIITTHCQETSQQVHHSSAVVGHDSQVVSHGHGGYGYGKREAKADAKAEAEPGYGYSSGPQCQDKKDRQCHKKPVQNKRKVPRPVCKTIVDTTYIEECEETFTTQCHTAHTQVHHSSAVVCHDSQVVAHGHGGYGYQKREAKAEPEAKADAEPGYGYSSGPQCHAKKDRQCHKKPVQNSHKVPRQVCVPVPREECHPIEIKVPRQVCNNFGYAVEHGSHHGHGYGYGR